MYLSLSAFKNLVTCDVGLTEDMEGAEMLLAVAALVVSRGGCSSCFAFYALGIAV